MSQEWASVQFKIVVGVIDLGLGDPDFALLPLKLIRRSAEARLWARFPYFLQYGTEQGDLPFRHALAAFLHRTWGHEVAAEDLMILHGASGALDLICTLFTQPGDTVLTEDPTYFLALRIFADHGLRVIPVPTDAQGLLPDALETLARKHHPRLLYTVPTFQNPGGFTLSEARRQQVVQLAEANGFLVVADEVYHLLYYDEPPPPPMAHFTASEQVISLGSFSKILAPGLRLGWVQAHPTVLKRLTGCGLLDSGGGLNPFTSALLRNLVAEGDLEAHVSHLRKVYGARRRAMEAALRAELPEAAFRTPQGGFFFWVRLPEGGDASALQEVAETFGVRFRPGVLFSPNGGWRDHLRLCFAFYEEELLKEGVRRLAQAVRHEQ
ncbi:MAG: PLP-dependent aminotransferase family protein [Anaerolineae bacterium]|nr:MAG: PLP-dependent aminotransferase family protein [Anaerolineae bacterium]